MANKRSNPFTEDFIPQSKTHVGLKQFNNNEDRLQKVYEKTLHLLFKGARKIPVSSNKIIPVPPDEKDGMKQLFIGKNGTLLHSGEMVQRRVLRKQCICGNDVESVCSYCEVSLCECCQSCCCQCERVYCSQCSLTRSESLQICVSCS